MADNNNSTSDFEEILDKLFDEEDIEYEPVEYPPVLWEDKLTCERIPKIRDMEFDEYIVKEETVFINCRIKRLETFAETSLRECNIEELHIKDEVVKLNKGNYLGRVTGGPVMVNRELNEIEELKDGYLSNTADFFQLPIGKISGKSTIVKTLSCGGFINFSSYGDGTYGIVYNHYPDSNEENRIHFQIISEGFPPKSYSYYEPEDWMAWIIACGEYPEEEMQQYFKDIADALEIGEYN